MGAATGRWVIGSPLHPGRRHTITYGATRVVAFDEHIRSFAESLSGADDVVRG